MERIIVFNQKGGVGKTAISINLAYCLAVFNKRKVLIMDLDTQCNTTSLFCSDMPEQNTVADLFNFKDYNPVDAIYQAKTDQGKNEIENLFIMPSSSKLAWASKNAENEHHREKLLHKQLNKIDEMFDFLIVDCPGAYCLTTINAVYAADLMLVPLDSGLYSIKGIADVLGSFQEIRDEETKNNVWLLQNMYDKRTSIANSYAKQVATEFADLFLKTQVRVCSDVQKTDYHGKTIFEFNPKATAVNDFKALGNEIERLCND